MSAPTTTDVEVLAGLPLLAEADPVELREFAAMLDFRTLEPGDVLLRAGASPTTFAIVLDGRLRVTHVEGTVLGDAAAGAVVGELALLRDQPRVASAAAVEKSRVAEGDLTAFQVLFMLGDAADQLVRVAGQRLATNAEPVVTFTKAGEEVVLRPLVPGDRALLASAIEGLSPRTRRLRFFTGGMIPDALVDHLVDLDYLDHFAWVVEYEGAAAGVSRMIRLADRPTVGEITVAVGDRAQGLGLGRVLCDAAAISALALGMPETYATILAENAAIKALLRPARPRWEVAEPGVLEATMPTEDLLVDVDPATIEAITATTTAVVSAAAAPHISG